MILVSNDIKDIEYYRYLNNNKIDTIFFGKLIKLNEVLILIFLETDSVKAIMSLVPW